MTCLKKKQLENENEMKEKQLDGAHTENETIKEKLQFLESKNIELTKISETAENSISLSEELSLEGKLGTLLNASIVQKVLKLWKILHHIGNLNMNLGRRK